MPQITVKTINKFSKIRLFLICLKFILNNESCSHYKKVMWPNGDANTVYKGTNQQLYFNLHNIICQL